MDCLRGWVSCISYKDKLCLNLKRVVTNVLKRVVTNVLPPLYSSPQWGTVCSDNGGRAGEATGTSVPARGPGTAVAYCFGGFED